MEPSAVLEAKELWKTFRSRRKTVDAVRGVSLEIRAGEVFGFLGPNGAGKTTTIKIIAGLVHPDRGRVCIMGRDPQHDPWTLREVGAVLEGNRNVYWRLTPPENLEYFGVLRGLSAAAARRRADELLARFDLADKRRETVQKLSRGMQQKLAIAVAYLHQPKLLLLDEPTLGLDVEAAESVKTLIREIAAAGHAILLTTHQLTVAQELADRVAIIRQGEIIAEASTRELIAKFSGSGYTIDFCGELSAAQRQQLQRLGVEMHFERVCYTGDPANLYQVFEVLRPLPLMRVVKEQADLTEVFLKLVREG